MAAFPIRAKPPTAGRRFATRGPRDVIGMWKMELKVRVGVAPFYSGRGLANGICETKSNKQIGIGGIGPVVLQFEKGCEQRERLAIINN